MSQTWIYQSHLSTQSLYHIIAPSFIRVYTKTIILVTSFFGNFHNMIRLYINLPFQFINIIFNTNLPSLPDYQSGIHAWNTNLLSLITLTCLPHHFTIIYTYHKNLVTLSITSINHPYLITNLSSLLVLPSLPKLLVSLIYHP